MLIAKSLGEKLVIPPRTLAMVQLCGRMLMNPQPPLARLRLNWLVALSWERSRVLLMVKPRVPLELTPEPLLSIQL